jgi:hypothetical protein
MGGAGRKGRFLWFYLFLAYDTPFVFRYARRMSEGPLVLLVYGKGKSKSSTAKVLLRHRWDGVSGPRCLGGRQCFYAIAWPVSWALVLFFVLFCTYYMPSGRLEMAAMRAGWSLVGVILGEILGLVWLEELSLLSLTVT